MLLSQSSQVMARLQELRAMFGAGQRAAALVEELFAFLSEVLPLMDEIDGSLRDSAGRMPQATSQLRSVTEATEIATTEILDLVDAALAQLAPLAEHLAETSTPEAPTHDALRRLLRERLAGRDDATLAEAEALLDERDRRRRAHAEAAAAGAAAVEQARGHLNRILVSLQVQDITAQQIAAVNHLIESVRVRLAELVRRLADGDAPPVEPADAPDPGSFNAHARYDASGRPQELADRILAGEDVPAPPGDGAEEPFDIDALFAASTPPNDGERASQDDIDALFGNA